jgi:hypothetical protein
MLYFFPCNINTPVRMCVFISISAWQINFLDINLAVIVFPSPLLTFSGLSFILSYVEFP